MRTEDGQDFPCDAVVLAAGAWSGRLAGLPRPLPVRPVKGQMIALATGPAPLRTMVAGEGCYLVPRGAGADSSLWVGATAEEVGFQCGTTDAARSGLRTAAVELVQGLSDAAEAESWDGFRPATPDDLPVVGPDPGLPGLIHASGHFRNGILLTPITAELVVTSVEGRADARLAPFRADRFAP